MGKALWQAERQSVRGYDVNKADNIRLAIIRNDV